MNQTALNFNPVRTDYEPPHNGTPTSVKAAKYIKPHAPSMRERILIALRYKPMTREELSIKLSMKESTVCGRVSELLDLGYVRVMERFSETSSGCKATVIEATDEGIRHSYLAEAGGRG